MQLVLDPLVDKCAPKELALFRPAALAVLLLLFSLVITINQSMSLCVEYGERSNFSHFRPTAGDSKQPS